MRTRGFDLKFGNRQIKFYILAKLAVNFSPRDTQKLKERLLGFMKEIAKSKPAISYRDMYFEVLDVTHEKQRDGMGKCFPKCLDFPMRKTLV